MLPDDTGLLARIKKVAASENFIVGVCDAAPLNLDITCFTPFVSRDHLKRTDPSAILPGVKSIIVVGVPHTIKDFLPVPEGAGMLSVLGVTEDYHIVVKTLLEKLVAELKLCASFMYKILVDSPTLDERALAVKSGLGFIGRSGLVISKEYGSQFNIGLLLMDVDVFKAENFNKMAECPPNCCNCINACPSGALSETGGFDVAKCISYLTQKDNLTPDETALVAKSRCLYGCDICQNACPFNHPQSTPWVMPEDWLYMSDDDFTKAYGHTAMMWRGAELLRRNAKILCT